MDQNDHLIQKQNNLDTNSDQLTPASFKFSGLKIIIIVLIGLIIIAIILILNFSKLGVSRSTTRSARSLRSRQISSSVFKK